MPPELRTCKWHLCKRGPDGARATFTPERPSHEFCSAECRVKRSDWKRIRGATLVDPLLEGDMTRIIQIRDQLREEVDT